MHWAEKIAEDLIKKNPNKKKFVLASGITPSGKVHIGNFRDIITSDLVSRSLQEKGYKVNIIFSWDNYDRLRKVPSNVPISFTQYIGQPISDIPDPYKINSSYSLYFEKEFEDTLPLLGIDPRFINQSEMYKQNRYYYRIKEAMQKRTKIAGILEKFRTQGMTEQEKKDYYPLQIYCKKCNNSINTKILSYNNEDILTYVCKCGNNEEIDVSKENIGKLNWKVDWAMRWAFEKVDFEPGGADHSSPGGSFDVSSKIAKEVFQIDPPYYQGYGFVGIEGTSKMSSSKGTGITLKSLLKIYEPELLRWLFSRTLPNKSLTLSFNTEIIRQYDEFDKKNLAYHNNKLNSIQKKEIEFSAIRPNKIPEVLGISFRQLSSLGQVAQNDLKELKRILKEIKIEIKNSERQRTKLKERLNKTINWINEFMPELKINLLKNPNKDYYYNLSDEEKSHINRLVQEIDNCWNIEELTKLIYEIPKKPNFNDQEKKEVQKYFFKNVYNLLIGEDKGPRLATFLIAIGKERVKKILTF